MFEERVVCFTAESGAGAHEKARIESQGYADQDNFEAYPQQDGYELDGDELNDGYEVWSVLMEAHLSVEKFYEQRYGSFR